MGVYVVWLEEPSAVDAVVASPGPWREVVEAAPGLLLVDSDETLSRVYHEVKWSLPEGAALAVAPVTGAKAKGLAPGTSTWLRTHL